MSRYIIKEIYNPITVNTEDEVYKKGFDVFLNVYPQHKELWNKLTKEEESNPKNAQQVSFIPIRDHLVDLLKEHQREVEPNFLIPKIELFFIKNKHKYVVYFKKPV